MKKFLALVLALVMTMSLVTISAGAEDFTDDASITYEEAVDVMTACGVVGGYADGSFNPLGTLTRGAAAKIICNMILGPTEAGALATVEAPFTDVPADHVFAGYIAYCVSEGIVSGYTDGTFRPAGTLTGYAFWKMLLGALGYEAGAEGYTGANYAINVAKRGLNIDLDAGLKGAFVGAKALTREEACLYAFNTMKAQMVEYDNSSSITIGDIVISNNSKAEGRWDDSREEDPTLFREEYFEKLTEGTANDEAFGRPSVSWKYDGKKIGTYAKSPILTYTDIVKEKDLFDDLGVDGYTGASSKYALITKATEDGKGAFTASQTEGVYTVVAGVFSEAVAGETAVIAKGENSNIAGTGKGTITEVYETANDNEFQLVFINEFITKVNSIKKADDAKDLGRRISTSLGDFETDDFAKDDYVLVTVANDVIKSAVAVEKLEDVAVTSYKADSVTIDGVTYKYSNRADTIADKGSYTLTAGNTYTFYLDSCGNIIKGEVYTATSTDYYKVLAVSTKKDDGFGDDAYYNYKVVDMTGAVSTVKAMAGAQDAATAAQYDIVTLKDDDDNEGYVKFSVLGAYNANAASTAGTMTAQDVTTFNKTSAKIGDISVNNNTVFVLQTGANKYKVVEGLSNMGNYTLTEQDITAVVKKGVAVVVYMDIIGKSATSSTDDLIYIVSTSASTSYDSTNKYTVYSYNAVVDGELDPAVATKISPAADIDSVTEGTQTIAIGLYKVTNLTDGYISAIEAVSGDLYNTKATTGKDEVSFDGGVLDIDGTTYVVDADVEILMIDADDNLTTDVSIDALTGEEVEGTFYLIEKSTSDATIVTIYFDGTVA